MTPPNLTPRQREVLILICCGLSNREIATQLYLEPNTIKVHVRHLFQLFEARDRTFLAVSAIKQGYISLDQIDLDLASSIQRDAPSSPVSACRSPG